NCYAQSSDCQMMCKTEMALCSTSADCCAGLVCGRIATFCKTGKDLDVGDPCMASPQCSAGLMCETTTCTRSCNDSAQCGAGVCLNTSKGFRCVASCQDSTDCAGTGLTCRSSTEPDG